MSKKIHSIKIGNETYKLDIPKSEFEIIDPAVDASYDGIVYDPNSNKPIRNTCVEYLSDDNGSLKNLIGNMNVNLHNSYETVMSGKCEYDITSNPDNFSLKLICADDGHDTWSGITITSPYKDAEDTDGDGLVDDSSNTFVLYNYDMGEGSHISIKPDWLDIYSSTVNISGPEVSINNNDGSYTEIGTLNETVYIGKGADTVSLGMNNTDYEINDLFLNGNTTKIIAHTEFSVDSGSITIGCSNTDNNNTGSTVLIGADPRIVDEDPDIEEDWLKYDAIKYFIVGARYLNIGNIADQIIVGNNADQIIVGNRAGQIGVGNNADQIDIGSRAGQIDIGSNATTVNIGNGNMTGHIYIGDNTSNSHIYIGNVNAYGSSSDTSSGVNYRNIILCNSLLPNTKNVTTQQHINIGGTSIVNRFNTGYFSHLNYSQSCAQNSDERLKNFGDNLKIDFDALAQIRKANYTWKDTESYGEGNNIGVSAQEVQKLYPEIVVEDPETELLSVDYAKLSVVALAAIDELYKENVELKSRLDKLEELITKLTK